MPTSLPARWLLLLAASGLLASAGADAVAAERPNLIVFYTDDHGYADLGIQGIVDDVKTPHTDALARGGVLVRHGYSTAPQCVPSRAGLLTGRFQARFGVESNKSSLEGFDRQTTFAQRLQAAGYATAQFGKWHLGPTREIPRHGFDHVFSQNAQRPFDANIDIDGSDRPMGPLDPADYHIDACSRAAAAMIERYSRAERDSLTKSARRAGAEAPGNDRPFFLYIAYRAPHTPLDPPPRHLARFPGEMPERRRAALAMIAAMDDGVGLVVETLKRHGLEEKTLIFYMADNGAPLKIHKVDSPLPGDPGGWDGSLNDPLNGEKGMLSEGGIHVPFVVSWPGTIPGGQVYEHPVTALDIAATAVAVAGASAPEDAAEAATTLDGVDLVPYLTGEKEGAPHEFLAWRWIAQSAIREGDWKLLRGGDREYLYHLGKDLEEHYDLSIQHPEIVERLRSRLEDWASGLEPPGLTNGEMAVTWHEYFDHYLENKPVPRKDPKAASDSSAIQGWIARNGTAALRDGALVLEPEPGTGSAKGKGKGRGQGPRPFLTHAGLGLPGPVTAILTFRARAEGEIGLAWRDREDKDFLPDSRVALRFAGGTEAQKHEIELPVASRLIHLRLHPSDADGLEILSIQLRGKGGREQSWDFAP